MSYGQIGEAFARLFQMMAYALVVFVPLGVWKLIDIVIWLFNHVSISWGGA